MGRIFFLSLLAFASAASLARPWIGVVAAYIIVVLSPQAVWWWNFQDLRPALWVLLPTLVGFGVLLLRGQLNLGTLRNSRTTYVLLLWLAVTISYLFGPYVDFQGPYRYHQPAWAISTYNKIFLLYLVGCVCIDELRKLKALFIGFAVSAVYLIYWANDMYLSGKVIGRLAGPVDMFGSGAYADENNFAMLFVVAQPILWYLGFAIPKRMWRWALWLIIPFGWHAVFLTGSRGGLIGIGVVTFFMVLRGKNKLLGLLLIPAFFGAYHWQAGDLMKSRAETIEQYETETSASTRLEAWDAARKMIAAHPLTGVGLVSMPAAFRDFSDKKPREAHNTALQLAAEAGVLAGAMYLLLVFGSIAALWRNGNRLKKAEPSPERETMYLLNEAILVSFWGFAVCALFLSLQMSEIFYCLCLMANAVLFISSKMFAEQTGVAGVTTAARSRIGRRVPAPGRAVKEGGAAQ